MMISVCVNSEKNRKSQIKEIVKLLEKFLLEYPQFRFGQAVEYVATEAGYTSNVFYISDCIFLDSLRKMCSEHVKNYNKKDRKTSRTKSNKKSKSNRI